MQIQSINIMRPNVENMIVAPITKRMKIIVGTQVCLISRLNFHYEENGGKKAFLANPKHQYHVSYYGEQDCSSNNQKNGDYYVYLSSSYFTMNFDYKENEERKLFLQIQSNNIVYPNKENGVAMPITKRMKIVMSIQVCPISHINFDYNKNGEEKCFSWQTNASISCIPTR